MQNVSPSHPHILYVGRVDCSDSEAPAFSYPGVNIRVRFTGTCLHIRLNDNALTQTVQTTNYFNVTVDGGAPTRLKTIPSQTAYVLAEKLSSGEHEVELFKRTESSHDDHLNVGRVAVLGFQIDTDATLLPPVPKALRMEVIGDSIVCGYGNALSTNDPSDNHYTTVNSNAYRAFGAIAARALNAEYVAVAYSGRGAVRNYGGRGGQTVPQMYLKTLPDDADAARWDPARYIPHIVVINLGTNDFSQGLRPGPAIDALQKEYGDHCLAFVQELRGYYADARFVLVLGPILSSIFPLGYRARLRVRTELKKIVTFIRNEGGHIDLLELPVQRNPYGEDFHPTIATHESMALALVNLLRNEKPVMKPKSFATRVMAKIRSFL